VALLLGYNTNGFAHHRLDDALAILADLGYRSVGLTLDVHHAPPGETDYALLGERLASLGLLPVVETGARFLLDPKRKHQPSLLSADVEGRRERLAFLLDCVDAAMQLGAPCVSLWSGKDEGGDSWDWLVEGLEQVCDQADEVGIDLAFEPEPGMLVDTMASFEELRARLDHPRLCLTLDVGHLHCLESEPPEHYIARYADLLRNIHLDDHRKGVHEHLMFGEGEIDFAPVMAALHRVAADRDLPATVELSRHSHNAVATARAAFGVVTTPPGARI
jgi:sugar phosphate isomerase/epimerase